MYNIKYIKAKQAKILHSFNNIKEKILNRNVATYSSKMQKPPVDSCHNRNFFVQYLEVKPLVWKKTAWNMCNIKCISDGV